MSAERNGGDARDARGFWGFGSRLLLSLGAFATVTAVCAQGLNGLRGSDAGRAGRLIRRGAQPGNAAANPFAAEADKPADGGAEEGAPALNWDAAPVDIVLQAYGERVNKTILKDPQVPAATITLKSRAGQKLTDEEYLLAIETILEMNQIHLEPYGESFVRALPRKNVPTEGIEFITDIETKLRDTGKVVSMMIPFKNISTEEAQKVLESFKTSSGMLLVIERTNSILVTDAEQNINRMLEISKVIDVASPVTEVVEYIQIKYANANDVKQVIDSIVQESMKELEKNGKAPQNGANGGVQPATAVRPLLGGMRRPGQPNQPAAPASVQSLVATVSDADRGMIRGKVVTIADERSNKILIITSATNMKFFKEVIAALDVETTPDVQVKVYRLKYADAEDVSDMINDLIGNSASSKNSGKSNQNQNAKNGQSGSVTRGNQAPQQQRAAANQRTGEAKAGELNKDNVTVLADKRINGLVVMARTEDIPTLEQIIESMDIKLSQVLIETAIVEVTLGDDLQTGVDWVRLGDKQPVVTTKPRLGANGIQMFNYTDGAGRIIAHEDVGESFDVEGDEVTTTWKKTGSGLVDTVTEWVRKGLWTTDGGAVSMLGGGGGQAGADILRNVVGMTTNLVDIQNLNPIGSGINYFFKSDKLNLGAVIQASKSDSRAKYIASPVVMTVDNKEAKIEATESRKFFNGYETSNGYSTYVRTPKYDDKDIGIIITVTPKINPNGTVMLEVEEEYSQLGAGQTILVDNGTASIDTALTRKMSADILLDNMQTVVLGGLTETYTQEKETGIPILKDIPIIGKWLFGSVSQTESRKELLVFMTPYVLSDSDAAQVEAMRRKKALSDPRPWDDHGWSLSKLADPVERKEQLRRLRDEWEKQDEERKTKIAIEKAKVERAKKLKELSKDERELWIKMHKEELEEEEQEELEKKMLDPESQEELKKLAEKIRTEKLAEADAELKAMAEMTAQENERAKRDAAEAEKPAADEKPIVSKLAAEAKQPAEAE